MNITKQKAKSKFSPEQVKQMEVECKAYANTHKCTDLYNITYKLAEDLADESERIKAYPPQALAAALAFNSIRTGKIASFL